MADEQNFNQQPFEQSAYSPASVPPASPKEEKASIILAILSFLFPFIGLIVFLVDKNKKPKTAKASGICALVSIGLSVIGSIIITIAGGAIVGSVADDIVDDNISISNPADVDDIINDIDITEEAKLTTDSTTEAVPAEYKSALKKAKIYSDTMHMSKAGIYDQLISEFGEKFSKEASQYAVDNLEADWNANALAKAKIYQNEMAMSPSAIKDQLVSEYGEKFTEKEADYAIEHLND